MRLQSATSVQRLVELIESYKGVRMLQACVAVNSEERPNMAQCDTFDMQMGSGAIQTDRSKLLELHQVEYQRGAG